MKNLACFIMICAVLGRRAQAQPAATSESGGQLTLEQRDGSRVVRKSVENALSRQSGSDLAGWWTGDGNARDSAGHCDGQICGGLRYVPGPTGQAFQFNGGDAQVDFGKSAGNFGTGDFTVAFWMKTNSRNPQEAFLGKREACGGMSSFWEIQVGSRVTRQAPTGFLLMQFFDGSQSLPVAEYEDRYEMFSSRPINDGQWHHIAWVRQSTSSGSINYLIYVDGALDNSKAYSEAVELANQSPVVMGQSVCQCCDGTRPYSGAASELQLFSHALSAEEILGLYGEGELGLH
jgi:hypothetical protein